MKIITDLHQHTAFSYDGRQKTEDCVKAAVAAGEKRVCFSEHYDYDCVLRGINHAPCDLDAYKAEIERLRRIYSDKIEILFGVEFGYDKRAIEKYKELIDKYRFDYVINSVHLNDEQDYYDTSYCLKEPKFSAYSEYLERVLESVNADFAWQIVGHIGYPSRYATYADKKLAYADHKELFDEILTTIIRRGKYLELNSSTKTDSLFLPEREVSERYIKLGGKNFTYGSDSHRPDRRMDKSDEIYDFLHGRGLHSSYFRRGVPYAD